MPEVRKIFLQTSVGEALGLPAAGQSGIVIQAREMLAADGFQCARRMAPQGHEAEEFYVRTGKGSMAEAMATLRYDLSSLEPERGQIVLTLSAREGRGIETRTMTLAEYVQEQNAEGQKHTLSPINDRKPSP